VPKCLSSVSVKRTINEETFTANEWAIYFNHFFSKSNFGVKNRILLTSLPLSKFFHFWKLWVRLEVQNSHSDFINLRSHSVNTWPFFGIFLTPLWPADLLMRMCAQMRLSCIYWTCVCVHRGSAWLFRVLACLTGSLIEPLLELVQFS